MLHGDVEAHGLKSFQSVAHNYDQVSDLEVMHVHVYDSLCIFLCMNVCSWLQEPKSWVYLDGSVSKS
jgi:hypothetical protein